MVLNLKEVGVRKEEEFFKFFNYNCVSFGSLIIWECLFSLVFEDSFGISCYLMVKLFGFFKVV